MTKQYPPIPVETWVKTTIENPEVRDTWLREALEHRKWGVYGAVDSYGDAHGLCYRIRHQDGTYGYYDPSELEVSKQQMVTVYYRKKLYVVKRSYVENKGNRVLLLTNSVGIDLTQTYVDESNPNTPTLRGSNTKGNLWGHLPIIGIAKAIERGEGFDIFERAMKSSSLFEIVSLFLGHHGSKYHCSNLMHRALVYDKVSQENVVVCFCGTCGHALLEESIIEESY